jgi:photosystem I reaction center subunit XII|uniref:Photosystem I reaction center subunit XII n=1 Tax=Trachelomonas volvocina TaxID=103340 RepID=A0A0G3VQZ4_9EUGL|nr:PSI M-polypeptide [Trachelomonas volvocina]AKL82462.1 PSI M-polypeptide [Trachelomonas volvocina]
MEINNYDITLILALSLIPGILALKLGKELNK